MSEEPTKAVVAFAPLNTIVESATVRDGQARKLRASKKTKQIVYKSAEVVSDDDTDMMAFSENHSVIVTSLMAQSDVSSKKWKQKTSTRISVIKKHQSEEIADTLSATVSMAEDNIPSGMNPRWTSAEDTSAPSYLSSSNIGWTNLATIDQLDTLGAQGRVMLKKL